MVEVLQHTPSFMKGNIMALHELTEPIFSDFWQANSPVCQSGVYKVVIVSKRINVEDELNAHLKYEADQIAKQLIIDATYIGNGRSINGNSLRLYTGTGYTDLAYAREGVPQFGDLEAGIYISGHAKPGAELSDYAIFRKGLYGDWTSMDYRPSEAALEAKRLYDGTFGLKKLVLEEGE